MTDRREGGGACVHTDLCVVEDVEDAGLRSLAAPARLQVHQQFGFIHNVHDLPQSLVPQSLHDGGKQHLNTSDVLDIQIQNES